MQAHVVTQTPFLDKATKNKWLEQGATEVLELVVPPEYKTPKGTLYKARNICYWQHRGGVGQECDRENSWVLSLDEEATISRSAVTSFIKDVLNHSDEERIGYALPLATLDTSPSSVTFSNKMLEAYFVGTHYGVLSSHMSGVSGVLFFHGGAYFARASVDLAIGNDWGPECSVSDDYSIGIEANRQGVCCTFLTKNILEILRYSTIYSTVQFIVFVQSNAVNYVYSKF